MNEYTVEALVLHKESRDEADAMVSLFTREYGKLTAKTKSSRKMLSKVNGHTQPGAFVVGRVVEKNTPLLVDALQTGIISIPLGALSQLEQLLPEAVPEPDVWEALTHTQTHFVGWKNILRALGWGADQATCATCAGHVPTFFHIPSQEFYCQPCALHGSVPPSDLLLV